VGRRGPKPVPTQILKLRGSTKRRADPNEPKPDPGRPVCPAFLSAEAKREWRRVVPLLVKLRLLSVQDRSALAAYCQAWAQFVESTQTLQREGSIVTFCTYNNQGQVTTSTKRRHPALEWQRDAMRQVRDLGGLFGLSPSGRSRLTVPFEPTTQQPDPLELLMAPAVDAPGEEVG
jgi:P27 family predicted phage terminase small subunit